MPTSGGPWPLVRVCPTNFFALIFVNCCAFAQKLTKICEKRHDRINFRANARKSARQLVAQPLPRGHEPPLMPTPPTPFHAQSWDVPIADSALLQSAGQFPVPPWYHWASQQAGWLYIRTSTKPAFAYRNDPDKTGNCFLIHYIRKTFITNLPCDCSVRLSVFLLTNVFLPSSMYIISVSQAITFNSLIEWMFPVHYSHAQFDKYDVD